MYEKPREKGHGLRRIVAIFAALVFALGIVSAPALAKDEGQGAGSELPGFDSIYSIYAHAKKTLELPKAKQELPVSGVSGRCTWEIDTDGNLVVRPTEGDKGELAYFGRALESAPWQKYASDITSVKFEGTVVAPSCDRLFADCWRLESVDLNGLDTGVAVSMNGMFYGCTSLKEIDVTPMDTTEMYSMAFAFAGCESLESISLDGLDTSQVTDVTGMFFADKALKDVDFSDFDTRNVKSGLLMFAGCNVENAELGENYTPEKPGMDPFRAESDDDEEENPSPEDPEEPKINLPDLKAIYAHLKEVLDEAKARQELPASGISGTCTWEIDEDGNLVVSPAEGQEGTLDYFGRAFEVAPWHRYASAITSVKFTGGIITAPSCDRLFADCWRLEDVDLNGLDTGVAVSMNGMFYGCTSLKSIDLNPMDTSEMYSMAWAFAGCESLEYIEINGGLNTSQVTDVTGMFFADKALQEINFSGFDTRNVKSGLLMFAGCSVEEDNFKYGENYTREKPGMDPVRGKSEEADDEDDKCSIRDLIDLDIDWSKIHIPSIDFPDIDISKIDFPEINLPDLKAIYAHMQEVLDEAKAKRELPASGISGTCTWEIDADGNLVVRPTEGDEGTLDYHGTILEAVPWHRFASAITSVKFQGKVIAPSCDRLFADCWRLENVDLHGLDTSQATSMNGMFYGCTSLKGIDLSPMNTSNMTSMAFAFAGCTSLESLSMEGLDTSKVTNVTGLFFADKALEDLDLTDFDTRAVKYSPLMFTGCNNIENIAVGKNYAMKPGMFPNSSNPDGWWSYNDKKWYTTDEIVAKGSVDDSFASYKDIVFTDVDETTAHEDDIYWLARKGISEGWKHDDGTAEFRPYANIARCDMAAFLFRLARNWGLVDDSWQPTGSKAFTDVTEETDHYREVMWLAESGISEGWKKADGTAEFRPYADIARADMAAFIARLHRLNGGATEGAGSFTDVDGDTAHAEDILWLASAGISEGWKHDDGTAEFRPYANVARADMAAFLHRLDGIQKKGILNLW